MAQSPLAIRSDHASGGADTARYITGTTLTGSLAAAHRLLHNKDTSGFESLFLSGKVFFPNLYPALVKDTSMHSLDFPVYPLPKTAQTCKRFYGFQYMTKDEIKKGDDKRHGVRDTLFDWALFNTCRTLGRDIESILKILGRHKYCRYELPEKQGSDAHCNETMEPFAG